MDLVKEFCTAAGIKLSRTKPRNHLVTHAYKRKAGKHVQSARKTARIAKLLGE